MGNLKVDVLTKFIIFKRKYELINREHEILKEHKIDLYKHRYYIITCMNITKNVLLYLQSLMKGINIVDQAEHSVDKELAAITSVRYLQLYYEYPKNMYNI